MCLPAADRAGADNAGAPVRLDGVGEDTLFLAQADQPAEAHPPRPPAAAGAAQILCQVAPASARHRQLPPAQFVCPVELHLLGNPPPAGKLKYSQQDNDTAASMSERSNSPRANCYKTSLITVFTIGYLNRLMVWVVACQECSTVDIAAC